MAEKLEIGTKDMRNTGGLCMQFMRTDASYLGTLPIGSFHFDDTCAS